MMNKIKVLHVITHLGVGGALDNTLLTVEGLSRSRFTVHLAAGETCPDDSYTSWEERSRQCADALFLFPDLRRPVHLVRDHCVLNQLTKLIKDQKYDVVHTHCSKAGVLGRIAARRAGVPVIVHTCHAFSWHVARQPEKRFVKRCARSAKCWLYLQLDRYAASLSDAVITVADLNKRDAIQHRLAPAEKITTIYSGIDLKRFGSNDSRSEICRQFGLDPDRPVVGTIGRLCPQKAPLDYVAAARNVLRQRPDAQLVIVGDGPLAREVRDAIDGEKRIKMLGYLENGPEIAGMLDVFALASLWEGLGRALTEALIMGVPTAATAVDGVPELIAHGRTGLLSSPGAPDELANNIVWLLDHPQEAKRMGERASRRVTLAFCSRVMVDRIAALYDRLLEEKVSPTRRQRVKSPHAVKPREKATATLRS